MKNRRNQNLQRGMQRENGLTDVYDTWWAKVNQSLHAYLCVNNSFSGSKVSGDGFPSATAPDMEIADAWLSCLRQITLPPLA